MTKDEALDLALEALGMYQAAGFGNSTDFNKQHEAFYKAQTAITAIKQARALDKKAENARELGLDYEPVPENFMDALRFDVAMRDAAPVQEPVAYPEGDVVGPCVCGSWPGGKCLKCPRITSPAAQRTWVGLTEREMLDVIDIDDSPMTMGRKIEAKLKEKNT